MARRVMARGSLTTYPKAMDEYQLQVPLSFRKFYYFDTIEELEAFKAEQEAKGVIFDGHKYKKERRDDLVITLFLPVLISLNQLIPDDDFTSC